MNESALNSALELLGESLAEESRMPFWLVVGGGSALLAQRLGTRQTKDVDVIALREWEGNVVQAYPLPLALKRAAGLVAEELRLDPNWLNGAASLHAPDFRQLPSDFWEELQTRDYGANLKVSFIGRQGLLLLKFAAALNRDQRRDIEDLLQLNPDPPEVEKVVRWLLRNQYESHSHPKLPNLLREIGHADLISEFS